MRPVPIESSFLSPQPSSPSASSSPSSSRDLRGLSRRMVRDLEEFLSDKLAQLCEAAHIRPIPVRWSYGPGGDRVYSPFVVPQPGRQPQQQEWRPC